MGQNFNAILSIRKPFANGKSKRLECSQVSPEVSEKRGEIDLDYFGVNHRLSTILPRLVTPRAKAELAKELIRLDYSND